MSDEIKFTTLEQEKINETFKAVFKGNNDSTSKGLVRDMDAVKSNVADVADSINSVKKLMYGVIAAVLGSIAVDYVSNKSAPPAANVTTGNVSLGSLEKTASDESQKEYLDSSDLSEKEDVSLRTVTRWANEGRIEGAYLADGRWIFKRNYAIKPPNGDIEADD